MELQLLLSLYIWSFYVFACVRVCGCFVKRLALCVRVYTLIPTLLCEINFENYCDVKYLSKCLLIHASKRNILTYFKSKIEEHGLYATTATAAAAIAIACKHTYLKWDFVCALIVKIGPLDWIAQSTHTHRVLDFVMYFVLKIYWQNINSGIFIE